MTTTTLTDTRVCRRCGDEKPLVHFRASIHPPKYYSKCRDCRNLERPEPIPKPRSHSRTGLAPTWKCEVDPDGDFTGHLLSLCTINFMVAFGSFTDGAILLDTTTGERWRVSGKRKVSV